MARNVGYCQRARARFKVVGADSLQDQSKVCNSGSLQIEGKTLAYCCAAGLCNAMTACSNGLLKARQAFLTYQW
jgi:hypothetical protein